MHPECLSVDLTHGTNSQNKHLNMVAFKDGNNNVFPGAHAFQPNARQVTFSLFFREGLAALWPKAVIERNRFFVTDGDIHMHTPLTKAKDDKIWPNTTLGRCTFHLLLLGWKKHVDPRAIENLEPTLRKTYRWIESWMIPGLSECWQHCFVICVFCCDCNNCCYYKFNCNYKKNCNYNDYRNYHVFCFFHIALMQLLFSCPFGPQLKLNPRERIHKDVFGSGWIPLMSNGNWAPT